MTNKFMLFIILSAAAIIISGCITDSAESKVIPKNNLPPGFTYMGTHDLEVDIGDSTLQATEGFYRYNGEDAYIWVIKNEKPEGLITQYKQKYKDANYNPFEEVSFNGNKALKVTDYSIIKGEQKPHYTVIWTTNNLMILVFSPTLDAQTVMNLATATGN